MDLHRELARKIASLEQEVAELRALHAQLVMQGSNVLPFPPRLRCEQGMCEHEQPEPAA